MKVQHYQLHLIQLLQSIGHFKYNIRKYTLKFDNIKIV